ncbi:hypothetical protein SteCoe_5975 [Stentor coeruleus]|uniref:FPL domain-containing protein n=1 Tax=Stentor coeruleus TaxID=5963 RepID=A0A1R2CR66_9CILI|nr:hypothetical protein SteCoe_5975 [Stentor coeruleus]
MVKISDVPSKYSLESFEYFINRNLHKNLEKEQEVTHRNKARVVEILCSLSEALIWSEQNRSNLFEYFSTSNLPSLLTHILCQQPEREVILQLLQSATLLIHNLTQESTKTFLIRSEFYSELISQPFDFTDEEIIENYSSLLKGLAVNLSRNQLLECVLTKHYTLFTGAMMFFNYPENLVKTASRAVVLNILKLNDQEVNSFILESGFFFNLANSLRESICTLGKLKNPSISKLEESAYDVQDTIYLINDIISQNNQDFNEKALNMLKILVIFQVLAGSIVAIKPNSQHVPIPIALYVLTQIMNIIKHNEFCRFLREVLFAVEVPSNYEVKMQENGCSEKSYVEDVDEMKPNMIYDNIFQFLRCRDDNLIALSLNLLMTSIVRCEEKEELIRLGILPGVKDEVYLKWVSLLGEIIGADYQFRFLTCYLACKLLKLLYTESILLSSQLTLQIMKNVLSKRIDCLLQTSNRQENRSSFGSYFENEWRFIKNLNWSEQANLPIHFISPSLDESSLNIPLENRNCFSDSECVITEIRLFFLYRELFLHLYKSRIHEINENPLKNYENSLDISKLYKLDDKNFAQKAKIRVRCKEKRGMSSKLLIKDEHFFILLSLDERNADFYRIEYCVGMNRIQMTENSDPKILILNLYGTTKIELVFDETMEWLSLKNFYEKMLRNSTMVDLKKIQSFINENKHMVNKVG